MKQSSDSAKSLSTLRISPVTAGDVPVVLGLVRKLAEYERLSHMVVATQEDFLRALFGQRPTVEALLAWVNDVPVGFALFFPSFSTFLGKSGLYLEDVFVEPAFRGQGIGKALLQHLARIARERDYGRMEWSVLNWNEPAIGFYKKLGAQMMDEWTTCRLTGAALAALAE
ncbi:MAG: GNAT family N-acetyltransferase [Bryobacteraceae bacterium]